MAIYVTSDTHFGHQMLVREKHRDAGFEDQIIKAWNDTVLPIDTVFHLGDFSLGRFKEYSLSQSITMWRNQIAGNIFLIKGNHDKQSDTWYFDHGFIGCGRELLLKVGDKKVLLSHEPREHTSANINIHGHLHGNQHRLEGDLLGYPWQNEVKYIDVSDFGKFGYKPVLLTKLAG